MPARKKSSANSPSSPLQKRIPYFCLALAAFAAYANIYGNEFLLDDEMDIVNNALLRSWHSFGAIFISSSTAGVGGDDLFYRPLQTLLYLVVYQIFGLASPPFRLLDVGLHAANGCLVYALGRRLGFRPTAVFSAALIWTVHPLFVEALHTSGTAELLNTFFSLLGLIILLPDFLPRKIWIACALYACALLSKETAILFPLLAASCLFLVSKDRLNPKIYLRLWRLAPVAAGYLLLRHFVLGDAHEFYSHANIYSEHIAYRIYTFLATLPLYAQLLIWPSCLHFDHVFPVYTDPWQWQVGIGAAMIAAACGQILWGRGRRGVPLSWGFLWFGSAHILHSGILLPVNSIFLEHWMYMPTAGLFLGAAQSVTLWLGTPRRRMFERPAAIAVLLAAAGFGARTLDQNTYWQEPIVFYNHIINCGTNSARVHNNLANAYMSRGEVMLAIEHFRTAIALSDDFAQTHHNLALALLRQPEQGASVSEAIAELQRAIEINPDFFQSYEMLANIYAWQGDAAKEAFYRARSDELRRKYNIPADEYAQPVLMRHR